MSTCTASLAGFSADWTKHYTRIAEAAVAAWEADLEQRALQLWERVRGLID